MALLAYPADGILRADGDYRVHGFPPAKRVVVDVGGVYGGAAVTLGYIDLDGAFKAYPQADGTGTLAPAAGEANNVQINGRGWLLVRVAGATGTTAIKVLASPEE